MKVRQPQRSSQLVIGALLVIILSGFTLLGTELWQHKFESKMALKPLSKPKPSAGSFARGAGKIYDTKIECSRIVFLTTVLLSTPELRAPRSGVANVLEQVHEIWRRIGRPPNVSYEQIKTHMLECPEQPLTVYSHLTDDEYSAGEPNLKSGPP